MDYKEIAKKNFNKWIELVRAGNSKNIAELYSKDTTFLPTVSPEFKRGQEGAESYFKHFLAKNPDGKIIEEEMQLLGEDSYLHSGMYNFEIDGEDGRITIEARFSYVWKMDDEGEWKIVHHHSSAKPE